MAVVTKSGDLEDVARPEVEQFVRQMPDCPKSNSSFSKCRRSFRQPVMTGPKRNVAGLRPTTNRSSAPTAHWVESGLNWTERVGKTIARRESECLGKQQIEGTIDALDAGRPKGPRPPSIPSTPSTPVPRSLRSGPPSPRSRPVPWPESPPPAGPRTTTGPRPFEENDDAETGTSYAVGW